MKTNRTLTCGNNNLTDHAGRWTGPRAVATGGKCPHPDCDEPAYDPPKLPQTCTCPTMIVIPAGRHIHVDCPVHGKRVMRQNHPTC